VSFGLLAPTALGLLMAALLPIVAHLIRRRPENRRPFGAMLLLQRLRRRVERRRQLHDLLLLALRVLALAVLLLAFARPELRLPERESELGGSGRVVVILDNSLSMDRRESGRSAFEQAQQEAAALVRELGEGVGVAVFAAGVPEAPGVGSFSDDHGLVAGAIEALPQAEGATDLDGALTRARALLGGEPGEVVVFTDGAGPGNVGRAENSVSRLLDTGSALLPRTVGSGAPANLVVSAAAYGDGLEGGTVSFTVLNYGPAPVETPATVRLPDGAEMTVFVSVPASTDEAPGSADAAVTVPRQAEGGVAQVRLSDPDLPLDDARYFHLPRVGQTRVMLVDGDPGSSPTRSELYFLERAVAPFAGSGAALDLVAPVGALRLSSGTWRVAVLANVGDPDPLAPTLVDFVRGGGALVLTVGDNVSPSVWNGALGPLLPAPLGRARDLVSSDAETGMTLQPPDAEEDLFLPFARAGRLGFERVRTRRVFSLEPYEEGGEVHTLLRYQSGVPALVERRVGAGRVLLWTSTADLGWTNFALQSVYAPFWARALTWLGGEVGGAAARFDGVVGEPVVVPVSVAEEWLVTGPGGQRVGTSRAPGALNFVPDRAGAYAIGRPDEPPAAWVAVNVPAAESDVRPDVSLDDSRARLTPDRVARRFPLDPALLLAGLALLVGAGWIARRRPSTDVEAAA
jgi:hypothetical protein